VEPVQNYWLHCNYTILGGSLVLVGGVAFKPSHIQFKGKLNTELKLALMLIYAHAPFGIKAKTGWCA